jgi:DNA-binding response OmpR family regulator
MGAEKILIVEDDRDQLMGLALRLKANGYQVFSATDGTGAFTQACKLLPDLIILDIGLPAGDGFKVLEWLAGMLNTSVIPVIVLSGRDPHLACDRVLRMGAKAFFQKPVDNDALLSAIREVLRTGACIEKHTAPAESVPAAAESVPAAAESVPAAGGERGQERGLEPLKAVASIETKVVQAEAPPNPDGHHDPATFIEKRIGRWREELRATPCDTDLMNDIAWVLATTSETRLRNVEEARQMTEKALSLMKSPTPALLDTQAAILAASGRFNEALDAARKGLALAQELGQTARAHELKERIRLYEANTPFVEGWL